MAPPLLNHLIDGVVLPYLILHLDPDVSTRACLLDIAVLNLQRVNRQSDVGRMADDMDLVSYLQGTFRDPDGSHADLSKILDHLPHFLLFHLLPPFAKVILPLPYSSNLLKHLRLRSDSSTQNLCTGRIFLQHRANRESLFERPRPSPLLETRLCDR